jgi:RNA polymerase sigma-70 factor, ECF subfamily
MAAGSRGRRCSLISTSGWRPPDGAATDNPSRAGVTETDLLQRVRDGDESAFEEVFRANYPALVQLVERMLRDRHEAEDVAQEALLELWRRRGALRPDGAIRAYLWQAARNRALNRIRHRRTADRAEPAVVAEIGGAGAAGADEGAEELEIAVAMQQAVEALPPRCREVFVLVRGSGLRYAEVAERLGISVKGVEAQMARALRMLRLRLAPWLPQGRDLDG